MTDKKLTDSEIVKALECCIKVKTLADCKNIGCPALTSQGCYYFLRTDEYFEGVIFIEIIKDALDLINRQKAEIEDIRRKALLEAASKFAGHSNYHGDTILCTLICMAEGQEVADAKPIEYFSGNQIKAEAYKEFADKVCDEITDAIINNGKVINERIEKHNVNRLEDSFCCMCDGKIRALGGIEYFIKNLLKELAGDKQ